MKTARIVLVSSVAVTLLAACASGPEPGHDGTRRFNPGHYVGLGPGEEPREIVQLDEPAIRGVSLRYFWRWLEPEPGEYDFSGVERDLEYLSACGKQLVVFVMDMRYSAHSPLPDYLAEYQETLDRGGFVPVRWDPYYIDRLVALASALNDAFGADPHFEGVAIQESSIEVTEEGYDRFGYTPERYRDALIEILTGMQARLSEAHVFWYQNFLPDNESYLAEVASAVRDTGVFMGGPDILPYRRYLSRVSYPLYEEFRNQLTLFCSAQGDSYRHHANDLSVDEEEPVPDSGYVSMEEIFLFARDTLHVRYIFWDYDYDSRELGGWTFDDALEVIREYPVFNEEQRL